MIRYDALIVGAGPAGAHLGYLLARRGAAVAVIDKSAFPRDKVCGGGLSRKALALLALGDDEPLPVEQPIEGAYLSFGGRAAYVGIEPSVGCTVLRSAFDDFLLRRACAAGVRFCPGTAFLDAEADGAGVALLTTRGRLCGRLLLGADGVASAVRVRLFGRHAVRYAPALEALVTPAGATPFATRALFDFDAVPRGYGWIFPKRAHLNVGVYSAFGARQLRARLAALLARHPSLREPRAIRYQGFAIPVRPAASFQRGPVWLLGDAAGLAEALFGEGIYFALKSAALAARALEETAFDPVSERYGALLRRELLPELGAARWLGRALFGLAPFLPLTPRLLGHRQAIDSFAGVISGALGYRQCLARGLAGLPRWLLAVP